MSLACYRLTMSEIRVEEIHIHPVKSCRRIEVDEMEILATGLAHDREWQIVDAEGACVTQRKYPSLATIETALDGDTVVLSASGRDSTTLSRDGALPVTVLPLVGRRPVNGVEAGDEAAAWISDFLGDEHRFAAVTDDSNHHAPSSIDLFEQPLSFVDLAPVLLTNSASLRWLQDRWGKRRRDLVSILSCPILHCACIHPDEGGTSGWATEAWTALCTRLGITTLSSGLLLQYFHGRQSKV